MSNESSEPKLPDVPNGHPAKADLQDTYRTLKGAKAALGEARDTALASERVATAELIANIAVHGDELRDATRTDKPADDAVSSPPQYAPGTNGARVQEQLAEQRQQALQSGTGYTSPGKEA